MTFTPLLIVNEHLIVSPDVNLGQTISDVIGSGETKYLSYQIANVNESITVVLNVTNGSVTLYASATISTPNEAFHDIKITTNSYEDVYIDPANITNIGQGGTIYIALQGSDTSNDIHVSATIGDSSTGKECNINQYIIIIIF